MTPKKLINNGIYGSINDTEGKISSRIGVCARIAKTLMPDRFIIEKPNEFAFAYMCEDETAEKYTLFPTQMVIRFKAGEVEIEFENERHEIGRFVYKEGESYCDLNSALVDKINQMHCQV